MTNDNPMLVALRSLALFIEMTSGPNLIPNEESMLRRLRRVYDAWDTEYVKKLNMVAYLSGVSEADPLNVERVWFRLENGCWFSDSRVNLREATWSVENTAN